VFAAASIPTPAAVSVTYLWWLDQGALINAELKAPTAITP
jgi:hypothetical protein